MCLIVQPLRKKKKSLLFDFTIVENSLRKEKCTVAHFLFLIGALPVSIKVQTFFFFSSSAALLPLYEITRLEGKSTVY